MFVSNRNGDITFVGKGPENGGLWAAMELSIVPHLLLQGVSVFVWCLIRGTTQFSRLDVLLVKCERILSLSVLVAGV